MAWETNHSSLRTVEMMIASVVGTSRVSRTEDWPPADMAVRVAGGACTWMEVRILGAGLKPQLLTPGLCVAATWYFLSIQGSSFPFTKTQPKAPDRGGMPAS